MVPTFIARDSVWRSETRHSLLTDLVSVAAVGGADGGLHDGFYYDRKNKLREEELESGDYTV